MPASTRTFCGLANYKSVLSNPDFRHSFSWTLEFVVIAVTGTVFLAMLLALALNSPKVKGFIGRLVKTAFILPMMLCPLIVANIWYIIFAPNYGLINSTPVSYTHLDVYKRQSLPDDVTDPPDGQTTYYSNGTAENRPAGARSQNLPVSGIPPSGSARL